MVGVVEKDDIAGRDPGRRSAGDRQGCGPRLPISSPFRPQQRLETEVTDDPQSGQAEDSVRWPVQERYRPRCGADGVERALGVVEEEGAGPVAAGLMAVTVQPDLVAGRDNLANNLRPTLHLLAADEEDRVRSGTLELGENGRCALGVGTVVEGKKYARPIGIPGRDPESPGGGGDNGRDGRRPVGGNGTTDRQRNEAPHRQADRGAVSSCTEEILGPERASCCHDRSSRLASAAPGSRVAVTIAPGRSPVPSNRVSTALP